MIIVCVFMLFFMFVFIFLMLVFGFEGNMGFVKVLVKWIFCCYGKLNDKNKDLDV